MFCEYRPWLQFIIYLQFTALPYIVSTKKLGNKYRRKLIFRIVLICTTVPSLLGVHDLPCHYLSVTSTRRLEGEDDNTQVKGRLVSPCLQPGSPPPTTVRRLNLLRSLSLLSSTPPPSDKSQPTSQPLDSVQLDTGIGVTAMQQVKDAQLWLSVSTTSS